MTEAAAAGKNRRMIPSWERVGDSRAIEHAQGISAMHGYARNRPLAMRDVPRRCGKLPAPLLGGRPFTSARLWAGGRGGVEEVGREIEFRIPQDLENRLTIRGGEPGVYGASLLAGEHVPQPPVDSGLRGRRHPIEGR